MQASYSLMDHGESFQAYAQLETRCDKVLSSAFRKHGIDGALDVLGDLLDLIDSEENVPEGVRWYLDRRVSEEDDSEPPRPCRSTRMLD
jgi:hypothetical protein